MSRALLIVDPQYDFIEGSLPVPKAKKAMDDLAACVAVSDYDLAIVTGDQHPWNHCSFTGFGGQWPAHCRQFTTGAAIWPPLAATLQSLSAPVHLLAKGRDAEREEYSIWEAADSALDLAHLLDEHMPEQIDVCGLAGDICVLHTLKDSVKRLGADKFRILTDFSPSLDGGKALREFCRKEGICVR